MTYKVTMTTEVSADTPEQARDLAIKDIGKGQLRWTGHVDIPTIANFIVWEFIMWEKQRKHSKEKRS